MVIDMMDEDDKDISKIQIANAPLVEGAVIAAVEASFNSDIFSIKKTVEDIIIKRFHYKKAVHIICTAFFFIIYNSVLLRTNSAR